jgi:hypothetical protein
MIANVAVTAAGVDLLVAPAGTNYAVVLVAVCNFSGGTVTVDVYVVPNGGSVANQTKIISARSLDANDSLFLSSEKILLGPGDAIHVKGSADSVMSATASYLPV